MTLHIDRENDIDTICVSLEGYAIQLYGNKPKRFEKHHASELDALKEAIGVYAAMRKEKVILEEEE